MKEIIDLSDSPPLVPLQPVTNFTTSRPSTREINTNSWPTDEFDDPFTISPWDSKRAKRRKISLEPVLKTTETIDALDDPYDWLTEGSVEVTKTTVAAVKPWSLDDDDDDDTVRITSRVSKILSKSRDNTVIDKVVETVEDVDDALNFPPESSAGPVSDRTAGILANIKNRGKAGIVGKRKGSSKDPSASPKRTKTAKKPPVMAALSDISDDDDEEPAGPQPAKKKAKLTEEGKQAKAQERQAAKEAREQAKATEKEAKRLAKAEQAKEKQSLDDIAAVNTRKLDRKETAKEMIIDISTSLFETRLGTQVRQYMVRLEATSAAFTSPIPDIIRWRRKCIREWNSEAGRWSPRPEYIVSEPHTLVYLTAKTFNDLISASAPAETLSSHVQRLKTAYPNSKPIYLIEGIRTLIASARNALNREHEALFLSQIPSASQESTSTSAPSRRHPKPPPAPISESALETALLTLQLTHKVHVHHTSTALESAEWIMQFMQHISTIPSKLELTQLNSLANFSFDAISEKSDDPAQIWELMLQQVHGIKVNAAQAILYEWPDVGSLVKGFREKGEGLLKGVRKASNRYGGVGEGRLGEAMSRRIHGVFMGGNEESTEI